MRFKNFAVLLLFVFGTVWSRTETSKNDEKKPGLDAIVEQFAPLECRAISLREHRFALAEQIRFTQDTLSKVSTLRETDRLQTKLAQLNRERETTAQQSLILADSIKHTLDSILSKHVTAKEEKDQFNKLLHSKLEQMHCSGQM